MPFDFLTALRDAVTGVQRGEPVAMDRYTRTPIYNRQGNIPFLDGNSAVGVFDPIRNAITTDFKARDVQDTLRHEGLHSLFSQTVPGRSITDVFPSSTFLSKSREKLAQYGTKGKKAKDLDDSDFEHLVIDLLGNNATNNDVVNALLSVTPTDEKERNTQKTLKRMFGRK